MLNDFQRVLITLFNGHWKLHADKMGHPTIHPCLLEFGFGDPFLGFMINTSEGIQNKLPTLTQRRRRHERQHLARIPDKLTTKSRRAVPKTEPPSNLSAAHGT